MRQKIIALDISGSGLFDPVRGSVTLDPQDQARAIDALSQASNGVLVCVAWQGRVNLELQDADRQALKRGENLGLRRDPVQFATIPYISPAAFLQIHTSDRNAP